MGILELIFWLLFIANPKVDSQFIEQGNVRILAWRQEGNYAIAYQVIFENPWDPESGFVGFFGYPEFTMAYYPDKHKILFQTAERYRDENGRQRQKVTPVVIPIWFN